MLFLTKHCSCQSSNYTRQALPASASTYKHTRPHGTGITCSATQLLQISHKEVTIDVTSILTITNQFWQQQITSRAVKIYKASDSLLLWVIFPRAHINTPVYIHWAAPCDLLLVPRSSFERCRHEPICPWGGRRWSCSPTAWPRWSESPQSTYNWRTDQWTMFKTSQWQLQVKGNDKYITTFAYNSLFRSQNHFTQHGVHRKFSHPSAELQCKRNKMKSKPWTKELNIGIFP